MTMAFGDRVFAAVFPAPSKVDVPTPAATPVLGSGAFSESFGSPVTPTQGIETGAAEQIKWDRSWHTATTFLALPDEPISNDPSQELLRKWTKPMTSEVQRALVYVISENSRGWQIRKAANDNNLLRWYFEEVVLEHYVKHLLPGLAKVMNALALGIGCYN